jgi:hypothetical protein
MTSEMNLIKNPQCRPEDKIKAASTNIALSITMLTLSTYAVGVITVLGFSTPLDRSA